MLSIRFYKVPVMTNKYFTALKNHDHNDELKYIINYNGI